MVNDISIDELKAAYRMSGMFYRGWGFVRSLETPSMLSALRGLAAAQRKKNAPTTTRNTFIRETA